MQIIIAFCTLTACTLGKKAGNAKEANRIHDLDSLPVTIIESETQLKDTTVFIDTTSSIYSQEFLFSTFANAL